MNRFRFFFILICISLLCVSCRKNRSDDITLDNSDSLSLAVDIEWAVINEPFVIFRESQEWDAKDVGHGKKGEILQITGYSWSSKNEKWVKFEKGFLPLKSVRVFSNRYQAANVSKEMTEE